MSDRQDKFNALVGKTIEEIDATAVNYLRIKFTDGSETEMETECFNSQYNIYGISLLK